MAGFPATAKCMACHRAVKTESPEIKRLAALPAGARPFPTRRVYSVADFVFFSHERHIKAGIDCRTCHGSVMEHDLVTKEVPTTMKTCVSCHKSNRASVACNICHELTQ